jgi:polysaccharide pyruvyl transferase WcaK-like protein
LAAEFWKEEIRHYYFNDRTKAFDDQFVETANKFDCILFGGGNFFEPRFPESKSGTTIDLDGQALRRLRAPVIFNAMGFDVAKGVDDKALRRFKDFMRDAAEFDHVKVTLRNDGSYEDFTAAVGDPEEFAIKEVPDPGISFTPLRSVGEELFGEGYVAINIAGDMEGIRYGSRDAKKYFLASLAEFVRTSERHIVFVPHVAQDVGIVGELLASMSDWRARSVVSVAPLVQGYSGANAVFSIYRRASAIISNRYHSLICNMHAAVPLCVIDNYPKMNKTLRKAGLDSLILRMEASEDIPEALETGMSSVEERRMRAKYEEALLKEHIDDICAFLN